MKIIILTVISFLSLTAFAKEKKHEHREHAAHVHGAGNLAIAFDNTNGKIEFKAAAEGILGFEYKPKSKKDIKTVQNTVDLFEKAISQMILLDPSLGCHFTKNMIGQVPEEGESDTSKHSDWAANFTVSCARSPLGSKIAVDFSQFKLLNEIDIVVLAGSLQKSVKFQKKPVIIELK